MVGPQGAQCDLQWLALPQAEGLGRGIHMAEQTLVQGAACLTDAGAVVRHGAGGQMLGLQQFQSGDAGRVTGAEFGDGVDHAQAHRHARVVAAFGHRSAG